MSAGSILLVRFENRDKLLAAVLDIQQMDNLKKWDAVDGYYGLVLKIEGDKAIVTDKVQALDGFAEMASCDLINETNVQVMDDDSTYSYLFMETGKNDRGAMATAMKKTDYTYYTAETEGDYDLITVIGGATFDKIDRIVTEEIQTLDGLLRMKQDRIIYLDKM